MRPRKAPFIATSVLVLIALTGCNKDATESSTAATVGPTQITDAQVAKEAKLFTFLGSLQQQQCGDTSSGISEEVACNRQALTTLIQGTLIEQYAMQNQIATDPQDVAALVSSLDSQAGKDKIDEALTAQGLTRADLDELATQVQLGRQVQHQLGEERLGDAKLRALYKDQLVSFAQVHVMQILVKTKEQADQIYQQVSQPGFTKAQFSALAKEVSTDPSVKQNGGEYPLAPASQYVAEFSTAAAALEPNEVSKPVKSEFGWHIIRMIDKQVAPFEEAKAQIALPQEESDAFDVWLRTQAEDQGVDVNPKFGAFDLETIAVVAVTSTDPSEGASASATPSP